jgi:hypothetical protein
MVVAWRFVPFKLMNRPFLKELLSSTAHNYFWFYNCAHKGKILHLNWEMWIHSVNKLALYTIIMRLFNSLLNWNTNVMYRKTEEFSVIYNVCRDNRSSFFKNSLQFTSRDLPRLRVTGFGLIIILKLSTVRFGQELLHCRDFLNSH